MVDRRKTNPIGFNRLQGIFGFVPGLTRKLRYYFATIKFRVVKIVDAQLSLGN